MNTLAIDPAKSKQHAWALFNGKGVLVGVGQCFSEEQLPWSGVGEVVVEVPRNYRGFGKAHRTLASMRRKVSAMERLAKRRKISILRVYPSDWKGALPKAVCHSRIENLLTDAELRELPDRSVKGYNDDVWDAVGIGLFGVGRAKRGLRT